MDDEEGTMKRARKSGGPKYVPEYIKQQATLYRAVGRSPAENSLQMDLGYIHYVRYLHSQKKKKLWVRFPWLSTDHFSSEAERNE